jgi:predicted nucleic acid-binding protein
VKAYVFDASALVALVEGKPGAQKVTDLLKQALRGRAEIIMSAVNYGEVFAAVLRTRGEDAAAIAMNALAPLPIRLIDATPQQAMRAAEVKSKYKLYYADSFAAALAIQHKATLVTSDSDFRRLSHTLHVVWLKV